MKKNEGKLDRVLRVLAGIALISAAVMGPAAPWGYIGIVPLATGLMGWCPLYTLLGINTCGMKSSES